MIAEESDETEPFLSDHVAAKCDENPKSDSLSERYRLDQLVARVSNYKGVILIVLGGIAVILLNAGTAVDSLLKLETYFQHLFHKRPELIIHFRSTNFGLNSDFSAKLVTTDFLGRKSMAIEVYWPLVLTNALSTPLSVVDHRVKIYRPNPDPEEPIDRLDVYVGGKELADENFSLIPYPLVLKERESKLLFLKVTVPIGKKAQRVLVKNRKIFRARCSVADLQDVLFKEKGIDFFDNEIAFRDKEGRVIGRKTYSSDFVQPHYKAEFLTAEQVVITKEFSWYMSDRGNNI